MLCNGQRGDKGIYIIHQNWMNGREAGKRMKVEPVNSRGTEVWRPYPSGKDPDVRAAIRAVWAEAREGAGAERPPVAQ